MNLDKPYTISIANNALIYVGSSHPVKRSLRKPDTANGMTIPRTNGANCLNASSALVIITKELSMFSPPFELPYALLVVIQRLPEHLYHLVAQIHLLIQLRE
jgi:hypothetical protein